MTVEFLLAEEPKKLEELEELEFVIGANGFGI